MRSKSALRRRVELHDQIERRAAIEDPADGRAREARLDRLGHIVRPQAVARDRRPVQHEPDERHVHLLLERQVRPHPARRSSRRARARPAGAACRGRRRTPSPRCSRACPTACDRCGARSAGRSSRSCRAASRSRGAAPPAAPRAAARSRAGRRRFRPPRRPARARRTRRGRCGAPWRRLPAAPAGSARRAGRSRRTWPATCPAACWPERSGCLRGTRAGTPCPARVMRERRRRPAAQRDARSRATG